MNRACRSGVGSRSSHSGATREVELSVGLLFLFFFGVGVRNCSGMKFATSSFAYSLSNSSCNLIARARSGSTSEDEVMMEQSTDWIHSLCVLCSTFIIGVFLPALGGFASLFFPQLRSLSLTVHDHRACLCLCASLFKKRVKRRLHDTNKRGKEYRQPCPYLSLSQIHKEMAKMDILTWPC